MNRITWTRKAAKQIRKIARSDAVAIYDKVDGLKKDQAAWVSVKKLADHDSDYRLRVGKYRVLFSHDAEIKIVSIDEVKKRDERTY